MKFTTLGLDPACNSSRTRPAPEPRERTIPRAISRPLGRGRDYRCDAPYAPVPRPMTRRVPPPEPEEIEPEMPTLASAVNRRVPPPEPEEIKPEISAGCCDSQRGSSSGAPGNQAGDGGACRRHDAPRAASRARRVQGGDAARFAWKPLLLSPRWRAGAQTASVGGNGSFRRKTLRGNHSCPGAQVPGGRRQLRCGAPYQSR